MRSLHLLHWFWWTNLSIHLLPQFHPKGIYSILNPLIDCTSASTITITMSADTLSPKSRDFFERSKMKQTLSMTFAGIGLLFLGMTCEDGGMSNASTILEDTTTGDAEDSLAALSSGYGFSCFFKLLASILSFGVSLYFSSFLCGWVILSLWTFTSD